MTSEIPTPDDISKIDDLDLIDEKYQAEWLEYTKKTLIDFLTQNAFNLKNNEMIRYEFTSNIFRANSGKDYKPSRYDRIWNKRYSEIVAILIDKGYFVKIDDFELPVSLIIALKEPVWILDAPPRKYPRSEYYKNIDINENLINKDKPWWQFW